VPNECAAAPGIAPHVKTAETIQSVARDSEIKRGVERAFTVRHDTQSLGAAPCDRVEVGPSGRAAVAEYPTAAWDRQAPAASSTAHVGDNSAELNAANLDAFRQGPLELAKMRCERQLFRWRRHEWQRALSTFEQTILR